MGVRRHFTFYQRISPKSHYRNTKEPINMSVYKIAEDICRECDITVDVEIKLVDEFWNMRYCPLIVFASTSKVCAALIIYPCLWC